MPEGVRQADAWLCYWAGRASMQRAPETAVKILDNCHRRFAAAADAAGQLACGAAVVQTLWYARLGWSEITPWVDRLEPLMAEATTYPSRAVELLGTSALHAAL